MDLAKSQLEISYTCEGFDLAVTADDLSGEIEIQVTLTGPDGDRHSMSKRASRGADGVRVARFRWPQIGFPVSSINAQVAGVDGAVCGGRARAGALVAGNLFPADDAAYKAMWSIAPALGSRTISSRTRSGVSSTVRPTTVAALRS